MAYRGKYQVKNPQKYSGNYQNVVYRSLWERNAFRWCDLNENIVKWNSEETVIPYRCKSDNKMHRYFVDLKITFKSGPTYLIEIKPKKETLPPKPRAKKTPGYIREVMTYVKNQSKWETADEYAKDRGYIFEVWTEETLRGLGIKILGGVTTKKKTTIT
jgi:hypothetical protein